MKVLVVEHFNEVFPLEMVKRVRRLSDISFDLLTAENYQDPSLKDEYDHIYREKSEFQVPIRLRYVSAALNTLELACKRIRKLKSIGPYDICHIHLLDPNIGLIAGHLRRRARHLIVSVYGSDLYRTSPRYRFLQRHLIEKADAITFTNQMTSEDFVSIFGEQYRSKIRVVNFGTKPIEILKAIEKEPKSVSKKRFGIPASLTAVTCGYAGSPLHQHLAILESISRSSSALQNKVVLLFPMTYGAPPGYLEQVKTALGRSGFNHMVFDKYLTDDDVAHLRMASDIMINVPESDQFSGSMQEHIFARNIVINGSWLPYDVLYNKGITTLKAASVEDVGPLVIRAMQNYDDLLASSQKGRDVVWSFLSWEMNTPKWLTLYQQILAAPSKD